MSFKHNLLFLVNINFQYLKFRNDKYKNLFSETKFLIKGLSVKFVKNE